MNSSPKLQERKLFWTIPAILGLFLYLNMYAASFFSSQEYFSLQAIILQIANLYLYWYISSKVLNLGNKITAYNFFISIATISTISIVSSALFKQYLIIFEPQYDSLSWVHFANYSTHAVIVAFTVTLLAMLVMTLKTQQLAEIENALLEKSTVNAQLRALQTQLDPHFLFNNLNTLQSMIEPKNTDAQDYLKNLSDLFRHILNNRDNQLITLEEEIGYSELFIALLRGRFKDWLTVEFRLEDTQMFYLPPFALQSLLENVIKHNRIDNTHFISCSIIQSYEALTITNNRHRKIDNGTSSGIGLENLQQRYHLLSDEKIEVIDCDVQEESTFQVKIPLLKINNYDKK
ncbi:MAG: sensor histidine kinase [Kangiellaceae bacterium]|nr:sensor histidine kinase [Kangiellaceae bacterium]